MRWRSSAWLGVVLGLSLARCSTDGFACSGDQECTLSGVPGVCLAGGRCAYPDARCPSGLVFPAGAPVDAGQCVPEGEVATESVGDAGSSSTGLDDADAGETDRPPVDSGGPGSSDGGSACEDDFEPNETLEDAVTLAFGIECFAEWEGLIEGPVDEDWFLLENLAQVCSGALTVVAVQGVDVCVVPRCSLGEPLNVLDCGGELRALEDGTETCCGEGNVTLFAECLASSPSMAVRLTGTEALAECAAYSALASEG